MKQNKLLQPCMLMLALPLSACDTSSELNRVVGQLESDRVELTADYAEPITERLVSEGDTVSAGQVLLRQDDSRIAARIVEADAAIAQNQARLDELIRGPREEQIQAERANVSGAKLDLEFRQIEHDRAVKIFDRQLASPETVDRAKANLNAANAKLELHEAQLRELLTGTTVEELRQAESAVSQAQAQLALLEVEKTRHQFVAPIDGLVDSILFEPGERPGIGQPAIIMLAGTQPYARVYIPETIRVSISAGTNARLFIDGLDDAIDGRVRWVSSEAAFTPYFALTEHDRGRLSFMAKVDLLNARERVPDGVPVEVEFPLSSEGQ
jgi:HlyD family secretion protein